MLATAVGWGRLLLLSLLLLLLLVAAALSTLLFFGMLQVVAAQEGQRLPADTACSGQAHIWATQPQT